MNKDVKLYNIIFPVWLLFITPAAWLIVVPANFIIDSAVILISLKLLKQSDIKINYKKSIFKVLIFGFVSDIIGGVILFLRVLIGTTINPFETIWSFLYALFALAVAGFLIYLFNYNFSFSKLDIDVKVKKKLALIMAIFTSPYLFLLPTIWFYK